MRPPVVYDVKTRKRLAYLQNAYKIGYTQQTNAVWTGTFSLPYSDDKKDYCLPFNLVDIWDMDDGGADKYVGLFKILFNSKTLSSDANEIVYTLEHVFGSLMNSSMVGRKEVGGTSAQDTKVALNYILENQYEIMWKLGDCDYSRDFKYEFDDANLLNAILEVPTRFADDYYWSYNTNTFPWIVHLKKASIIPIADIRYKKNLAGMVQKIDARGLINRLYVYGKKNDNGSRLTIASVNNGKEYLEDGASIAKYGLVMHIVNDDRFESPETLRDYGAALLAKLKQPLIEYELNTQIIHGVANLKIGDCVRIITEDGLDQNLTVQEIVRDDITGSPNSGKITLGTGTVEFGLISKSFI